MMIEPGKILDERYEIISLIGEGGMGTVYHAREKDLNRDVAIKFLNIQSAQDTENRSRFLREAKVLSVLEHKNILKVFRLGIIDNTPFIATEFLEGRSLATVLSEIERLPLERLWPIATQLCEGLAYAHKQGVIHRDLKPANIMLIGTAPNETIKILDFGLARLDVEASTKDKLITKTGMVIGSLHCMSPEQCSGERVDLRADIYAVGCMLYQCVSGKLPHNADNPIALMRMHASDAPVPLRHLVDIPPSLENIILKAMAKRKEDRFQSMEALHQALESAKGTYGTKVNNATAKKFQIKQVMLPLLLAPLVVLVVLVVKEWEGIVTAYEVNKIDSLPQNERRQSAIPVAAKFYKIGQARVADQILQKFVLTPNSDAPLARIAFLLQVSEIPQLSKKHKSFCAENAVIALSEALKLPRSNREVMQFNILIERVIYNFLQSGGTGLIHHNSYMLDHQDDYSRFAYSSMNSVESALHEIAEYIDDSNDVTEEYKENMETMMRKIEFPAVLRSDDIAFQASWLKESFEKTLNPEFGITALVKLNQLHKPLESASVQLNLANYAPSGNRDYLNAAKTLVRDWIKTEMEESPYKAGEARDLLCEAALLEQDDLHPDEAVRLYEEALAIAAKDSAAVSDIIQSLSIALVEDGKVDKAYTLIADALAKQRSRKDTLGVASLEVRLGEIAQRQQQFRNAIKLYNDAIPVAIRLSTDDRDAIIPRIYDGLLECYDRLNDEKEFNSTVQRALLDIRKYLSEVLREDTSSEIKLKQATRLIIKRGDYKAADQLINEIENELANADHKNIVQCGRILLSVAKTYASIGERQRAIPYIDQFLKGPYYDQAFGGLVLLLTGQAERASRYLQWKATRSKDGVPILGKPFYVVYESLLTPTYMLLSKIDRAESWYQTADKDRQALSAAQLNWTEFAHRSIGCLQKVIKLNELKPDPSDRFRLSAEGFLYADIAKANSKPDFARQYLLQTLTLLKEQLGEDHPAVNSLKAKVASL